MTGYELDQILKLNSITKTRVAAQLGISQASFEQKLKAKNVKQEFLNQLASVVDFDIDREYERLFGSQEQNQGTSFQQILPGLYDGTVVDKLLKMIERKDVELAWQRQEIKEMRNMYDKVVSELINIKHCQNEGE